MISVIVPVYNVEKYLDECVESILKQTYKDLEIILVDDGSTDDSGKKCDKWAELDDRIVVYHKPNGGLMSAWKHGVSKSRGEFVGFVDSDDWIDADMYETLIKHAKTNDAEIVVCGLVSHFGNASTNKETILLEGGFYDRTKIKEKIFPIAISSGTNPPRGISPSRVTKLYKKTLVLKVIEDCPDNVSIGEDLVSTISAITQCRSLYVVRDFYPYHYRINQSSMIQTYSDKKYESIRNLNNALLAIDEKNNQLFFRQIANDYICSIFGNIEQEILFSGYNRKRIKRDIKIEVEASRFVDSLRSCDTGKLPSKIKIYLILTKMHFWTGIIVLRKAYKRKI